ncbi:MAG: hypothetical protein JOS17DRAFT_778619 [Linnemannia elongata]|nr:MAG: hypothetical protein JOS17DRAFT_778619 [Linnemannia elongata]
MASTTGINNILNAQSHQSSADSPPRPNVLIIGAGLGGLTLGMLLHKANIPFDIFERASEVKNIGSAMMLTSTTAYLFQQCGIYDEFVSLGKKVVATQVGNEQRELEYTMKFGEVSELFGYENYIIARSVLYDFLHRQVPKERIHMSVKITETSQDDHGVRIHCSNGAVYEGDILVGADGAYSIVRQSIYNQLKAENKLPLTDALPLPYSTVCLVGQTRVLDVSEFPRLTREDCQFMNIIGDNKPYSWMTFTTRTDSVAWVVVKYLDAERSKHDASFNNSEWGPEAAETFCKEIKDFPIISGSDKPLTLGDLIGWTDKDKISKVMLEEKLNPAGGAGATNALHDAISLANYIYALPPRPTTKNTHEAFTAYRSERIPWAKAAFDSSSIYKTMASTGFMSKLVRFSAKYMPLWIQKQIIIQMNINRPQACFLPRAEDNGSVRPAPQPSLSCKAHDVFLFTAGTV